MTSSLQPSPVRRHAEPERTWLDETAWVDVVRGFVVDPQEATAAVLDGLAWQPSRVFRYERWIDEPRMAAGWRPGGVTPHPVLPATQRWVQARYHVTFGGAGLALYRDGRDSMGAHRDTDMRYLDDTLIAILTLGAQRPWVLQRRGPRHEAPRDAHDIAPAGGDLFVMGGSCQRDWLHSVPKAAVREPRISAQWRWASRTGRPVQGPSYSAPRHFSR